MKLTELFSQRNAQLGLMIPFTEELGLAAFKHDPHCGGRVITPQT